jgi:hypothetical protein
MTHSVNGNIIAKKGLTSIEYRGLKLNELVSSYMRWRYIEHKSHCSDKITKYFRVYGEEDCQPFIEVFNKPQRMNYLSNVEESNLIYPNDSLILRIRSGSHVGFNDYTWAKMLYEDSRILAGRLSRRKKELRDREGFEKFNSVRFVLLFDDEHKFYTPKQFLDKLVSETTTRNKKAFLERTHASFGCPGPNLAH